jgi:hypothetical protein
MKKTIFLILFFVPFFLFAEIDDYELNRCYVTSSASIVLPQGGGAMSRKAGGEVRFGYYFNEFWSVEGSIALLENRGGYGLNTLWHWYGYERLDPFFLIGARGWTSLGAGPNFGVGTFYHLDDNLSLKIDASSTVLAEDGDVVFSLSAGLQYSW